jgi:small GTP-binding protein
MDLRAYEQAKFELTDILRLKTAALSRDHDSAYERFRELFARLAEDRFNLVVAGRISRGKTSLMNAILGTDRLPTGIVPLTSVITSVTYGSRERVQIEWKRGGIPREIRLEELADYVTERANPGNTRGIHQARIELPVEILRRGFYFVDTPGLESAIAENTLTTETFLPEADALILVSGYESPLSDEELRVIKYFANTTTRIFFVLNKQDMVSERERREAHAFARQQLKAVFAKEAPAIFSTSAVEGLAAKINNNASKLVASGLPELELALTRFLVDSKNRHFLLRMCDRAFPLMDSGPSHGSDAALKQRIRSLRARLEPGSMQSAHLQEVTTPLSETIPKPSKAQPCDICREVDDKIFEFLCHYQLALVTDPKERTRFVKDRGFCTRHWWLYASIAAPRDICVAVAPLLAHISTELQTSTAESVNSLALGRVVSKAATRCRLCSLQRTIEREAIAAERSGHHSWSASPSTMPAASLYDFRTASQPGNPLRIVAGTSARGRTPGGRHATLRVETRRRAPFVSERRGRGRRDDRDFTSGEQPLSRQDVRSMRLRRS